MSHSAPLATDAPRRVSPSDRALQDRALFRRLRDPADPLDRQAAVQRHIPLARSVAAQLARGDSPFEDVFQVACFALVKAVDRYEPDRGIAFSSYAVPTMVGEIKRYFRDRTWSVRPPRSLQELSLRLEREIECWSARNGDSPSVGDMARLLGEDEERVLEALQAGAARISASLDAPAGDGAGEDARASVGDLTGGPDPGFGRAEDRVLVDGLLAHLTERERAVVRMRFVDDLTQEEIGCVVGVSQMQVSRILRASLERLRILARVED